jgi:hypothetical protein
MAVITGKGRLAALPRVDLSKLRRPLAGYSAA